MKHNRFDTIVRCTIMTFFSNLLLAVVKIIAGTWGGSMALIADGLHSLSDGITDVVILISTRIAQKPPDDGHRYGHGKAETMAAFIVGIILAGIAIEIAYSSFSDMVDILDGAKNPPPGMLLLAVAAGSVLIKELLFRVTRNTGRRISSDALIANAWHHRSDALSSLAALLGLGGIYIGGSDWAVLDPAAALISALLILYAGWETLQTAGSELMEQSLDRDTEKEIIHIISSVEGMIHPHELRTRKIGHRISVSVHIYVDSDMSVRHSHDLTREAEHRLFNRFGDEIYTSLHVEPLPSDHSPR